MHPMIAVKPDRVVTVSYLSNYLARKLRADRNLQWLGVSGEITGLSTQPNGTLYFDLKDGDAVLKCVAWSEAAAAFPLLDNGQAVIAIGTVGAYVRKGTYQLTVYDIELEGAGRLHALYEKLKRRLDTEGLFAQARKRPLPVYPFRVALVSSRAANGAGDFLTQAAALAPHVTIELFETPVQGDNAVPEIVRALDRASAARVDLVVLARGGGSYQDLFVFSNEHVVRALARCAHPTVSAIGHEADTPLTDFVADYRAATPSTAAQTVLPRRTVLLERIERAAGRLDKAAARSLESLARDLQRIEVRSPLAAPGRLFSARRQALELAGIDLTRAVGARLGTNRDAFAALKARLDACNPNVRLSRRRERLASLTYSLDRAMVERMHVRGRLVVAQNARLHAANPSGRVSESRAATASLAFALLAAARNVQARENRRLATASGRLLPAVRVRVAQGEARLRLAAAMLDGRDPRQILGRGYAIVLHAGKVLRSADDVAPGAQITAQLARGTLCANVESVASDGGE